MRNDKLTSRFQNALADAQSLAVGRDNQMIEPAHLLAALLDQQGGSLRPLFAKAGANAAKLKSDLGALLDRLPKVEGTRRSACFAGAVGLLNVTDKLAPRAATNTSSELFARRAGDRGGERQALKKAGVTRRSSSLPSTKWGREAVNSPMRETAGPSRTPCTSPRVPRAQARSGSPATTRSRTTICAEPHQEQSPC